jgi:hypothetical protein
MNLHFYRDQPSTLSPYTRLQNPPLLHISKVAPIDQLLRFLSETDHERTCDKKIAAGQKARWVFEPIAKTGGSYHNL